MAVVLGVDISPGEEIVLLFPVNASGHVTQYMLVGVDEPMAGCDVSRRAHANHTQPRAAGKRFVYALVQLGKGVAHVGETVVLASQRRVSARA